MQYFDFNYAKSAYIKFAKNAKNIFSHRKYSRKKNHLHNRFEKFAYIYSMNQSFHEYDVMFFRRLMFCTHGRLC